MRCSATEALKLPARWVPLPEGSVEERTGDAAPQSAVHPDASAAPSDPTASQGERPSDAPRAAIPSPPRCPMGVVGAAKADPDRAAPPENMAAEGAPERAPPPENLAEIPGGSNAGRVLAAFPKFSTLPLGLAGHSAPPPAEVAPEELPGSSNAGAVFAAFPKSRNLPLGLSGHNAPPPAEVAAEEPPRGPNAGCVFAAIPGSSTHPLGLAECDAPAGTEVEPEGLPCSSSAAEVSCVTAHESNSLPLGGSADQETPASPEDVPGPFPADDAAAPADAAGSAKLPCSLAGSRRPRRRRRGQRRRG